MRANVHAILALLLCLSPVLEVHNEVMEDLRVHVLGELHEDEPVSEPEVVHDEAHVVAAAGLGSAAEHEVSRVPATRNKSKLIEIFSA